MKKLSIIAAWLCALMYFGVQAQAVAFASFSGQDPGSSGKRLSIESLKDCKSFWTIPADTWFQSVALSTQAEVDAFSCVVLVGHLAISGRNITSIEPLSSLKTVSSIRIGDCDNLVKLNGLHSLEAPTGINCITAVALDIAAGGTGPVLASFNIINSETGSVVTKIRFFKH